MALKSLSLVHGSALPKDKVPKLTWMDVRHACDSGRRCRTGQIQSRKASLIGGVQEQYECDRTKVVNSQCSLMTTPRTGVRLYVNRHPLAKRSVAQYLWRFGILLRAETHFHTKSSYLDPGACRVLCRWKHPTSASQMRETQPDTK